MRSSKQHSLIALLLIGIALAVIWIGSRINMSFDATANKRHALSQQTINAVSALSGPVDITAVVGPDPIQRNNLTELISRYQTHNPLISLQFVNPETNPEQARSLNAAPGGELILTGMGREQRLQSVSERALTGALRQLNREGDRKIAFITGHEERDPAIAAAGNWSVLAKRLQRIGLVSDTLSLVTNPRIPDDIDVLVIADPRRPYFPGEIASLLQYINQGGSLLWLIETDLNKQTGSGLSALALELGIEPLPGLVIDTASQNATNSPAFVVLNAFSQHPVTQGLTSPVLLPQTRALSVTALAGQSLLPVLQTPESSWTETGALEGEVRFNENTEEQRGPLPIAVSIERLINEKNQRIIVMGDADFASDQFIGNGANFAFAESTMLWLSGETDALNFVTQAAPDADLILNNKQVITISVLFLFCIPLLLLLTAAILAWRQRRS